MEMEDYYMRKIEKISESQFMILVLMFTIGTSILLVPGGLAFFSKQDGWMSSILGLAFGMSMVWIYVLIGKSYPQKTLIEIHDEVLGKWLGKAVSTIFLLFIFILTTSVLWDVGNFLTTVVMPETPIQAVYVLFISIVIMGVRLGMEVIARTGEILLPWVIGLTIIFILLITPEVEMDNLQPMFAEGLKPILRGALHMVSLPFLQLIIFVMLIPTINNPKTMGKSFLLGTLLAGIILSVITLLCILVMGSQLTQIEAYPTYDLAKKINLFNFLQRLEAIITGVWFISIFFKLCISFYALNLGIAQIFKLQDYRPLTFPLGLIVVVYGLVIAPNVVYINTFAATSWFPFALTVGGLIPLVLLLITKLKVKQKNTP